MFTNRIKGKLALITGASAGIGEATAEKLAKYGVNLYLVARREDSMKLIAQRLEKEYSIKVYCKVLDVTNRKAVVEFGKTLENDGLIPDILVNNAGLSAGKERFFEADIDDWEKMIDTNIKGLLYVSRAVAPMMVKRNSGHIVNLGSIAGLEAYIGGNVYNATKFAVRGLTEGMSLDLLDTKVRVSNVSPGAVETEFSMVRFKGDKAKANAVYKGFTPLEPSDIADVIAYVVNAPTNVNVKSVLVTPVAQRNVSNIKREI